MKILKNKNIAAVLCALLAALFFAVNTPFSKVLLQNVPATFMAAFLYLGAGLGVGVMYLFHIKKEPAVERLSRKDLPYTISMIALDILAPIFLMFGISIGSAANASLLGNFEIVATTLIALFIFKESVSKQLWTAIALITLSSIILSFDGNGSLQFSRGSLFVILATMCWGLENNCARQISNKSAYEIVLLKGFFSGGGAFVIAMIAGEKLPAMRYILLTMLLGFIAYGLSIFLYTKAQKYLGAAKTSAYYAVGPFIGAFLSFAIGGETLSVAYFAALIIMLAGSAFVVYDTMTKHHIHSHRHIICHTHNGTTHTHIITHEHIHSHFADSEKHQHKHKNFINSKEHLLAHRNTV